MCHQRDRGSHVAADAVAADGQLAAVDADLLAVLADPPSGCVGLIDLNREPSLGHGRVLGEHRHGL